MPNNYPIGASFSDPVFDQITVGAGGIGYPLSLKAFATQTGSNTNPVTVGPSLLMDITTSGASIPSQGTVQFTVINPAILQNDTIFPVIVNLTSNYFSIRVGQVTNGSFGIDITNAHTAAVAFALVVRVIVFRSGGVSFRVGQ